MKIAVSGKGGVGKTTLAALLASIYAKSGKNILAVDADPSPCLAGTLGFPQELMDQLQPISQMNELIEERTGAKPGTIGGFFTLNPRVDDIPERFSVVHNGIRLLEMGSVDFGGSGCICPESALLKTLFTHLFFRKDDVLVLDMYAGIEHLGRGTVDFVDLMIAVVEPTHRSIEACAQITKLAHDIGLKNIGLVANKIRSEHDLDFIRTNNPIAKVLGSLPIDPGVQEADQNGFSVYEVPALRHAAEKIIESIEGYIP